MSQPDDGVRDIGSPFRVFNPMNRSELFDVDFHPQVVRADEIHPSEVLDDPKDSDEEDPSSVQASADDSSTTEKSESLETQENSAPVEKASLSLVSQDSPPQTSPGSVEPPVETPPLPPAKTRSSQGADKSS